MNQLTFSRIARVVGVMLALCFAFLLGTIYDAHSHAQSQSAQPTIEEISPVMRVGSLGTNTALVHELYADKAVVNGIDLLQMDQELINYLATRPGAEAPDLQRIVDRSRASKLYKVTTPQAVPPVVAPKPVPDGGKK